MPEPTVVQTLDLSESEERRIQKYVQGLFARTAIEIFGYPLLLAKILFHLGYRPNTSATEKVFVFAGCDAFFLPYSFKCLRNIYRDLGFRALFTGLDAATFSNLTGAVISFAAQLYIDRYCPEIGGIPEKIVKKEAYLTDHESFRIRFCQAIRTTFVRSIGIIISRPLTVIMVREIAQLVGSERKYDSVFEALLRIGHEEGAQGFFSGLVSALIADVITIWGCFVFGYGLERTLIRVEDKNTKDEVAKQTRRVLSSMAWLFINSFSYPFNVVSTVMALNGSGLAILFFPHSRPFTYWGDCYDYLKSYRFSCAARLEMRLLPLEQKITV